jgi:LysR family transcriptional regulator, hydrogen peroxide-inducible genes activator
MTLQQMEYIVAVDKYRHFITAAEHCHVTQPTLSMMIQKLEDELDIKIFDRSKQPVIPTEIGKIVVEHALIILREANNLRDIIVEQKELVSGELRLGIIPTIAPYLTPLFIKHFSENNPNISLFIVELTTDKIIERLKQDTLDVGILATPLDDKDLFEAPIFFEEFVIYAAAHEVILEKRSILPSDIDASRLILLEEGHCMRTQIINLCELKKAKSMINNVVYEASSIETLKSIIHRNAGITILPELALINMDEEQMKYVRFFEKPAPVREVSIVTHRTFIKKRLIEALRASIVKTLPLQLQKPEVQKKVFRPR